MRKVACLVLLVGLVFPPPGIAQPTRLTKTTTAHRDTVGPSKAQITFIEIGSVNCIPCKAMQPVMKAIEAKYGDQIRVIFYDVWTKEQAHYAREYNIRLIPTQVFLDESGKELMRHEGFYPEEAIDVFLQSKGLKPRFRAGE